MTMPILVTDSCTDLPLSYLKEEQIPWIPFPYFLDEDEHIDTMQVADMQELYEKLRNGSRSHTSQINSVAYARFFKELLKEEKPILYLAFSSVLSSTYQSAVLAKEMILEEYPQAEICIIDSRCASAGEGLLVYYMLELLKQGKTQQEVVDWVETYKWRSAHLFTVDDLMFLRDGGRIGSTAAFLGTMLNIKPVLKMNLKGELIPFLKERSRKKAIRVLFDLCQKSYDNSIKQRIFIRHADCLEDALFLKELFMASSLNIESVDISYVGPIIGSHVGPGTLGLFFLTKEDR